MVWKPIINQVQQARKFPTIKTSDSLSLLKQDPEIIDRASNILASEFGPFSLAGFELLTRTLKSFILPLAVFDEVITPDTAVDAGLLESELQASKYGIVADHHELQRSQVTRDTFLGLVFLTSDHQPTALRN